MSLLQGFECKDYGELSWAMPAECVMHVAASSGLNIQPSWSR